EQELAGIKGDEARPGAVLRHLCPKPRQGELDQRFGPFLVALVEWQVGVDTREGYGLGALGNADATGRERLQGQAVHGGDGIDVLTGDGAPLLVAGGGGNVPGAR